MTMPKAPATLALFSVLFVLFLLLIGWGNELLAQPPQRSSYPHNRQYATMEIKAVFGFAPPTQWALPLSGDRPLLQYRAISATLTPPEALWLTQDQSLTIASGACAVGSTKLCAVIVGINDPKIRAWAKEICGLPIFWDLKPDTETSDWSNSRILDLETLQDHPLNVTVTPGWLILHISNQAPIHWQETTASPVGCNS